MNLITVFTRFPDQEACLEHLENIRWEITHIARIVAVFALGVKANLTGLDAGTALTAMPALTSWLALSSARPVFRCRNGLWPYA